MTDSKDKILRTLDTTVKCFLYYDREEDEDLPMGYIEAAISSSEISIDDIVIEFKRLLIEQVGSEDSTLTDD